MPHCDCPRSSDEGLNRLLGQYESAWARAYTYWPDEPDPDELNRFKEVRKEVSDYIIKNNIEDFQHMVLEFGTTSSSVGHSD